MFMVINTPNETNFKNVLENKHFEASKSIKNWIGNITFINEYFKTCKNIIQQKYCVDLCN